MHTSHYSRLFVLFVIFIGLLPDSLLNHPAYVRAQTASQSAIDPTIPSLIYRQKYNDAITRIEQVLEREPANPEALTYLATANLYQNLKFVESQKEFEQAFKAGGGATFFVNHSHEAFSTGAVVDYCRGWLHLRKDGVEYVPLDSNHGLKLQPTQIEEFKRNRLSKKVFHIKVGGKSQNFRGRSNTEFEPLLIIALYKSFNQN